MKEDALTKILIHDISNCAWALIGNIEVLKSILKKEDGKEDGKEKTHYSSLISLQEKIADVVGDIIKKEKMGVYCNE